MAAGAWGVVRVGKYGEVGRRGCFARAQLLETANMNGIQFLQVPAKTARADVTALAQTLPPFTPCLPASPRP